ncbi:hypothetical protein GKC56_08070 [Neisseriaceae bacterium PsAf]|nr:hypothetical protein [Neisseriaceae bacterium PsAf]
MFRRLVFIGLLGVLSIIGLSSCNKNDDNNTKTVRIGYQKFGPLVYLKENQILEKELASKNIQVKWKEFTSGPPMLEALNTGSIDFANTGETPPVFAQSGGSQIVYVAYEPASPQAEAILIP